MSWRIELLAYDGCLGFEVFGLRDVLAIANSVSQVLRPGVPAPFQTRLVSARGARVRLAGGATVDTQRASAVGMVDQIVVPGFDFVDPAALDDLLGAWGREVRLL